MASRNSRRSAVPRARRAAKAGRPSQRLVEAFHGDRRAVNAALRCAEELARPLRGLRKTYPATTIVLAMLAQTAAALLALLESGELTRREAARYYREFGWYVLGRKTSANGSSRQTP